MKVILNYGNYYNFGKQYQAEFIYSNPYEEKNVSLWLKNNKLPTIEQKKDIDTIKRTNIPQNILLQFINELVTVYDATIIVGNKEITRENLNNVIEILNKLLININLKKGKYFGLKDTYYVTFKYATDEQREEVAYDFNMNLFTLTGNNIENGSYIFPFIIDRNGKITTQNTGIIGGTNIPTQALPFFLQKFINEYNAIISIDESLKENMDDVQIINKALTENNRNKSRILSQKKGV